MVRVASALVLIATMTPASAQAPKATARISGRVVAAATGRPLLRATVRLQNVDNQQIQRTFQTDANGQYDLVNLPAGRYSFVVTRTGYLDRHFDQPHPLARFRLLELAEGEHLQGINFSLHRGAAITGVITDEAGDPLLDVRVVAMREQFGSNGRTFRQEATTLGEIRTDDEGRYRVYGLRPGTYVVRASVQIIDGDLEFGKTYYPGTSSESDAQTVHVDVGLDAVANFAMVPAKSARVAGIVLDSQSRPASGWRFMLHELHGSRVEPIGGDNVRNDGSFEMERVLPGRYMLQIRPPFARGRHASPNDETAIVPLTVAGDDISELVIRASAGSAVSGRVTFEGSALNPVVKGLRIGSRSMEPAPPQFGGVSNAENGMVDATGRFTIAGVRGKVRIGGGGAGWFTKRVILKGVDVTIDGFDVTGDIDGVEVVLTNKSTTVTGSARDARGIGRNDYIVAFFPAGGYEVQDRASRQRTIRPDPDGVYRILNLPAGDYIAAAVPAMSLPIEGEWDPAFLEKVRPWATGFTLLEGQTRSLNLRVIE